jgi:ribosomal protein S18 acetylase RimI-like enzyme
VDIREVAAGEVLGLRREIVEIWPEASRDRLTEILPRHTSRNGFRFFGAFDAERLLGFVYGYRGEGGQWWHDRVASALGPEGSARWLAPGHFEFTELHVRPEHRRRGIGGTLHDAVLSDVDAPTAVLSTQTDNVPAIALYEHRGWETIVPHLDFGSGRPFLIMGKDLQKRVGGP